MTFPLVRKYKATAQPVTTAGNSLLTIVDAAEEAETVTLVQYIPHATQNGADTNSRTLTLFRRGSDGTGTTVVATLPLTNGVNLVDNVAKTIPLSGTAANLLLAAGEVMEFSSAAVGTGIADPGGRVIVTTARTGS